MDSLEWFIIPLLVAVLSWKAFEWFSWSRSKSYRSSRWQYYKAKFGFSLTAFILCLIVGRFVNSTGSDTQSGAVKRSTEIPAVSEKISNNNNYSVVGNSKFNEVVVAPYAKSSRDIKELTEDEMFELEEKVQYHGDDPIVRSRLGLPPARK